MESHTYAIMDRVEDTHWWFVGRRAILETFLDQIVASAGSKTETGSKADAGSKFKVQGSETETGSKFKVQSSKLEESSESDNTNLEPGTQNSEPSAGDPERSEGDSEPAEGASVPSTQYPVLKILDVGCGTGANLEMLAKYGDAEGVDVSDEALEFCRSKGLKAQKGLAEELPFEDQQFDLVTALDVVEHLDDDVAGLREMQRVLRKGGRALFFVPAFMWLWGVQDDVSNHRIRYTKKQIVNRLEKAGFVVQRATYANISFFAPILLGRTFMRLTGVKPESENNINISALNGVLGSLFSAESHWLKRANLPFGVSAIVVAEKPG